MMDNNPKITITAVILMGLYFTLTDAFPNKPTAPHQLCEKSMEDQNLPDPSDCTRYFRCVYGRKVPKICPEKMLFNLKIGNCDLHYNVECTPKNYHEVVGDQRAIETLTGNSLFKTSEANDVSEESSNSENINRPSETSTTKFVYMPHETVERAYYKVENGAKFMMYCEENMSFNFELEICARPSNLR
ncbi:unnamed protein product [Ceutorhynchus assimilis]|uniref:Chitin-binding type-2 domain-containing protein n=1 Tax=Ceutorhynchus assimilis TaxID=467358 RepID=A0A9N9MU11_9CUCU|nr:unnamed protein product [Ceutorhynchus assimilis]